jgi:CheY-like chemotaxis protein
MPKILLIDDDKIIYSMYQKAFTYEGFEIDFADNGQAGLDKVKAFNPDLILLDVMMPKVNGLEVLEILKADPITNHIPVVMLSNLAEFQITNNAITKGATQYIIKSDTTPKGVVDLARNILDNNSASTNTE